MLMSNSEVLGHNLVIAEIEHVIRGYYIQLQFSKTDPYILEPDLIQTVIRLVPEKLSWNIKFKVSQAIVNFDKKRPRNIRETANQILYLIQRGDNE